jgi:endonuclease/exonuclease/phosphatase family metal-dependent hydrolase
VVWFTHRPRTPCYCAATSALKAGKECSEDRHVQRREPVQPRAGDESRHLGQGRPILEAYSELNSIFQEPVYTVAHKARIVTLLTNLGLAGKDDGGNWAILRQNRGDLLKRSQNGLQVVANGRSDWIGWLELKREATNETATRNVARVFAEVNADVVGVVEAEDRVALCRFNEDVLEPTTQGMAYDHIMLIDGNDDRGIDVAIMTNATHPIEGIRSHVDVADGNFPLFSRDCPEFSIKTPAGNTVLVLVNHLKSKGYGSQASSNAKRERQAKGIKTIYDARRAAGIQNIAVIGDFNDTPDSVPLRPLLQQTDLKDVFASPAFVADGHPGTWKNGTPTQKLDYVLLSRASSQTCSRPACFGRSVGQQER